MHDDHDHSQPTHSAKCDEKNCKYIAKVHAHDDEHAAMTLSHNLAKHNKEEHKINTNPDEIKDAVKKKMQTHS